MRCFRAFLLGLAFTALVTFASAAPPTLVPRPVQPFIPAQPDAEAQKAAQAWLKSIGYDLTIEQMLNLTRLNLGLYSLETAQLITDENSKHLRLLKNLEEIELHRQLGDATLANLAELTKLRVLAASTTRVTGPGLVHLKKLAELRTLLLHGCQIHDQDLSLIAHLAKMEILGLDTTPLTDAALPYLTGMTGLKKLFLSRTGLSDKSLPYFRSFRNLERLDIQGTKITSEGAEELKRMLPKCWVVYP